MKRQMLLMSIALVTLLLVGCSFDELTWFTNSAEAEENIIQSLKEEDFEAVERQLKEVKDISSSDVFVLARKLLYLQQDLTRAWEKGDLRAYEEAWIELERIDERGWMRNYRQSIEPQLDLLNVLEETMKEVDKHEKREEYVEAVKLIKGLIDSEDENVQQLVKAQHEMLNERLEELTDAEEKRLEKEEEVKEKEVIVKKESTTPPAVQPTPSPQQSNNVSEKEELQQLKKEYEVADRELNRLWGILKANLSESEFQPLLQEQRQWIKDKEAHAKSEYNRTGGGTTGEIYRYISLIYFTETRVNELQSMYGYY